MDTEVNRFLIEFHRRQRAELLVPESRWTRALSWIKEFAEDFRPGASLSYASGFAALALLAFVGLSQQVQVAHSDGQYKLSLGNPGVPAALAMLPTSLNSAASTAKTDSLTFTPAVARTSATSFILGNTRVAYDATAAF